VAAKHAASTATQCIAAAQGAAHHNTNKASQEELMGDCKTMADHIPSLVEGVKGTLSNPENPASQLNLINASEQFLQVCDSPPDIHYILRKVGALAETKCLIFTCLCSL